MTLTPEERAIYLDRLTKAEVAYHEIMVGGGVKVLVDQNGERIEFNQGSASRLAAYIAELRRILGLTGPVKGPLRFFGR